MARFHFDPKAEELERALVDVYFEMQEYRCGVRVFDDVPVAIGTKIANGRTIPTGIAVQIPEPTSDEPRHAELMDRVKRYGAELIQIRQRFHPGYDIADVRDGPPKYANAIAACRALHMPLPVSLDRLLEDAIWCDDRMVFFWSGASPEDIREIASYLSFLDYWINRLRLPNAPESPDPRHLTPHIMQNYFRKVRSYMEVAMQGMVTAPPAAKTPPDRAITLDPDDVKILRALADTNTTMKQVELEQYTVEGERMPVRNRISKRLTRMRKAGLTHRPNTKKGGEAITDAGRNALKNTKR